MGHSRANQAETKSRIFFALWPNQKLRSEILGIQRQLPASHGRPVAQDNWHITLSFVGEVDRRQVEVYAKAAVGVEPVDAGLVLDQLGYFARTRVLWLGCSQTPVALQSLVKRLNKTLHRNGHRPERRPFQAHLTLLRNAKPLTVLPAFTPLSWRINGFVLVESMLGPMGASYRIIKEYLCAG